MSSQISFWNWLDLDSNLETYVDICEKLQSSLELQSNPGLGESNFSLGKETGPKS